LKQCLKRTEKSIISKEVLECVESISAEGIVGALNILGKV